MSLYEADLSGANLSRADLREVDYLSQEQLDVACGDDKTKIAKGLTRPVHWTPPDPKPEGWAGCPSGKP